MESTLGRGTTFRVLLPAVRASVGAGPDRVVTPSEGRILVVDDEVQVSNVVARILRMPEMSGIDLHDRLTRDFPTAAGRVIFMSGGTFSPLEEAYLSRVGNPMVAKPFSPEELRALIQRHLRR